MLAKQLTSSLCLAATLLIGIVVSAHADVTVYSSPSAFANAIEPGYYLETFTGGAGTYASQSFTGNGFDYTVTAGSGTVYRNGEFIGNTSVNQTLTVTFGNGGVTAMGGYLFITNVADAYVGAPVRLTLSDGTSFNYTPTSATDYRGLTSTIPITSLTMQAPGANRYNTLDNFVVGSRLTVVPEAGTLSLFSLAGTTLAGVVIRRRR